MASVDRRDWKEMDTVVPGTSAVVVGGRIGPEAEPEKGRTREESPSVGQNSNKDSKRVKSEGNWCKR